MALDITRRDMLGVIGMTALFGASTGEVVAQADEDTEPDVSNVCVLRGTEGELSTNGGTLSPKEGFNYLFLTESGDQYISFNGSEWRQINMDNPTTQVDELRVEDFTSFFNHTFTRPGAPDDKNWLYVPSEVTKDNSEIELASTTALVGTQRGNYPPGSEAIPGVAFRVTGTPTAGECFAGYFEDMTDNGQPDEGFGFGSDAQSDFLFLAKEGTLRKIRQSDWNGVDSIDSRPFVSRYPRICRFPHLFYGGGAIQFRIVDHLVENGHPQPMLKTVHTITPPMVDEWGAPFNNGPPFSQPNLPPSFISNGLTGANLRANASHYESGKDESEARINGEFFGGSSGTTVGQTGWTHVMSWRKRDGWDMVNVKPLRIGLISSGADVQLELLLGSEVSGTDYSLPTHTDGDETSVEVSTAGTLDNAGQRRWVGYAQGGGSSAISSSPGNIGESSLDFNLPSDKIVTLAANGVGGSADVFGFSAWEEFF